MKRALLLTALLCTLAACTGRSGAGSGGGNAAAVRAGAAAVSTKAGPATDSAGSRNAPSTSDLVFGEAKIRTAEMTVAIKRSHSVGATADTAESIALRAGGEVDADERTAGADSSARLVLRVPPEQLTTVLDQLAALGVERSRHLATEDVTSKVADVTSRVDSAREAIARLRELYSHATKISDVITIESELADRESDLESLEAQQRSLAAQTATASVTLSLVRQAAAAPPVPQHHHRTGFLAGLQKGWDAFAGAAVWVAAALGALLPFVLLLALLAVAGRLVWPHVRPARTPPPTPVPPQ